MEIIGIEGERIRLVPLDREAHLENIVRWFNDPEVRKYLNHMLPISKEEEEKFFDQIRDSETDFVFAILDEKRNYIGITGIHELNWQNRSARTGMLIGEKSAWGKGYGTDVVKTRTRYIFEQLGLNRIKSETFVENGAMVKVFEKCGFTKVGVERQIRWRDGKWHDQIVWEMIYDDYLTIKENY